MRINEPILTIIVPIYNTEKYLSRCIDSLIQQCQENITILLVDDGSTDNSSRICDGYASNDKRIKVIHTANYGVSSARNIGLKLCTTPYVMFVDSDDYVSHCIVDVLINLIIRDKSDMALCGYEVKDGKIIRDVIPYSLPSLLEDPYNLYLDKLHNSYQSLISVAKVFKMEIIVSNKIEFRQDLNTGEDRIFNMSYMPFVRKLSVSKKSLYTYYYRHGSATFSRAKPGNIEIFRSIYSNLLTLSARSSNSGIKQCLADEFLFEIMECFGGEYGRNKTEIVQYFKSVINYPETKNACESKSSRMKTKMIFTALKYKSLFLLRVCDLSTRVAQHVLKYIRFINHLCNVSRDSKI